MTGQVEEYGGRRFAFGRNWQRFLEVLDEDRVLEAEKALAHFLGTNSLEGRTFLDIGSGSGLSSLAARRLGATVHSFDYDADAVACTQELKRRFFPDDRAWQIQRGSVLDAGYLGRLGNFDVVYSWGVLHHTGAMWQAIENAAAAVKAGGTLYIAIYNDQGWKSRLWRGLKWVHNVLPQPLQPLYDVPVGLLFHGINIAKYTVLLKPQVAVAPLIDYKSNRGMSCWHDMLDWIGGYPYEVATFEKLEAFVTARGFRLTASKRESSLGCHQLVFVRHP